MQINKEDRTSYIPLPSRGAVEPRADERGPVYDSPETLLREAKEMAKWNDPDLTQTIRELAASCRKNNTSFEALIMQPNDEGDPFLLQLLRQGDHHVLVVIHRNVKNGWPVEGLVERTDDAIRIHEKETGISWGFQQVGACMYVGPFLHGERHGSNGHLRIGKDWFYRGDFLHNKKHGMGEKYRGGLEGRHQVGLFIDDLYCGNPHPPAPKTSKNRFSILKKML